MLGTCLFFSAGCSSDLSGPEEEGAPIAFSARTDDGTATRSGTATTDNLTSMGVFACYTGQQKWIQTGSRTMNFMYDQAVSRTGGSVPWTYTPVKYWPNTDGDKISFFAYAPHANGVEGLEIISETPELAYTPPKEAGRQTDLLCAAPLFDRTKGSDLTFTMEHVLTQVMFKVRSTTAVRVTDLAVNRACRTGVLRFNDNPGWITLANEETFTSSEAVDVAGNTVTDICTFFLLPLTAESVSVTFTEGNGQPQTKTVLLPESPEWERGRTVAYTLVIDDGIQSEISLEVESWKTGTVSGSLGEEPDSYPKLMGWTILESPTKAYIVGGVQNNWPNFDNITDPGWYTWNEAMRLCRAKYNPLGYPGGEWRLPNKDELENIHKMLGIGHGGSGPLGSSYWSITTNGDRAWAVSGSQCTWYLKTTGYRLICVRDVGTEMTYPTVRTENGFKVVYRTASNVFMRQQSMWGDILEYDAAVTYCNNLREGGYSNWRLPTESEAITLAEFDMLGSTHWTATKGKSITGDYMSYYFGAGGWGGGLARPICVRDYY